MRRTLATTNLQIGTQAHSPSGEGRRYFGLMEIMGRQSKSDYCRFPGLRNSHDQRFPRKPPTKVERIKSPGWMQLGGLNSDVLLSESIEVGANDRSFCGCIWQ